MVLLFYKVLCFQIKIFPNLWQYRAGAGAKIRKKGGAGTRAKVK